MENASKALIIAGAILLAILLIALGVYVFQQASANTGTEQLSSTEVQSHNDPFSRYEGKCTGTEVKALLDTIRTNNINYPDARISVSGECTAEAPTDFSNAKEDIVSSQSYTVSITGYYSDEDGGAYSGYIKEIKIEG